MKGSVRFHGISAQTIYNRTPLLAQVINLLAPSMWFIFFIWANPFSSSFNIYKIFIMAHNKPCFVAVKSKVTEIKAADGRDSTLKM